MKALAKIEQEKSEQRNDYILKIFQNFNIAGF